jgi:uncharacterized membrane protein
MIEIEYFLSSIGSWFKLTAEFLSILIIAAGIIVACYKVLLIIRWPDLKHYNQARLTFSRYLVIALEFQLAADIIATAIKPTWTDLGMLAAIAAIRTFLNYFLEREMREEEDVIEKMS